MCRTRIFLLCSLVLGSLFLQRTLSAAEPTKASGELYCSLPIPDRVSMTDLERVLRFVTNNRRWILVSQTPVCTVVSLNHQGIRSRVWFYHEKDALVMRHESVGPDGRSIVPSRWLNNLRQDIEEQFSLKR